MIFIVHAVVVAALVAVSSIALFGSSAWWGGGLILHACEFWVYRWVFPWFNDPVFARPSFLLYQLSGSSPSMFAAVYEWLMVSTFGGGMYALAAVVWVSWRRRRGLNVAASSAA